MTPDTPACCVRTLRVALSGDRIYSPIAYAFGLLLSPVFSGGPAAWLRGRPRPELVAGSGRIALGHVALYPGVKLHCIEQGSITIGDGSYVNRNSRIAAARAVRIGRESMVSWDVAIADALDDGAAEPVEIGDRVWIGAKAIILGGTHLADGCVVAAGSVVRGEFPAGSVLSGQPAEVTP